MQRRGRNLFWFEQEVGGAVKNVLAVATGFSDGSKFGANTRGVLLYRGYPVEQRVHTG
jgi:glycerol-3-phosphate dehydrogenase